MNTPPPPCLSPHSLNSECTVGALSLSHSPFLNPTRLSSVDELKKNAEWTIEKRASVVVLLSFQRICLGSVTPCWNAAKVRRLWNKDKARVFSFPYKKKKKKRHQKASHSFNKDIQNNNTLWLTVFTDCLPTTVLCSQRWVACFFLYAARDEVTLMTATANPIHLMHIMKVHSIKTSHCQAATLEQLKILVQPTEHSYLQVLFFFLFK